MTETKDIIIRRAIGNEEFEPVTGSVVLEEGGFYIHVDDSSVDLVLPLEAVLELLKEALVAAL